MQWKETFIFNGKSLYYNRIGFNNIAERSVEIPIGVDFYNQIKSESKVLEIGNVLANYESLFRGNDNFKTRRIIDKYEVAAGVENIDLMELNESQKYNYIISISTVEHIGQENSIHEGFDGFEEPLKGIAKIYDLLDIGGKALITVPFGKLINGLGFIQFSQPYINLLQAKYQIPAEAISKSYLKRIATEIGAENPRQLWIQAEESELGDVEFSWPWPYGNAIAAIELTKLAKPFSLNLNLSPEPWAYSKIITQSMSLELMQETFAILERLREIDLIIFPDWSSNQDIIYHNLQGIIKFILTHPDKSYISLIVDTSNAAEEDAELILSDIIISIFDSENLDNPDEAEIILLGKLDKLQWQTILPRLHSRVIIEAENNSAINTVAENMPAFSLEDLSDKRAIQLETGVWILN